MQDKNLDKKEDQLAWFHLPIFIQTLWTILQDQANRTIVRWNPHGFSFSVLDQERFENELLPQYYKTSKLESFLRQLNIYEFSKFTTKETGVMEFLHENFQRDRKDLLPRI